MKRILEKEDPILRDQAEAVTASEFNSNWLVDLANSMISIMKEMGAVGVAAPQIGVSKRVIVFGTNYTKSRKIDTPVPDIVLINPSLKVLSEEMQTGYEGCLNCGELRGEVPRPMEIEYSGYDLQGTFFSKRASGLEARIVQHEIDHLNGILFFDHVKDKDSLITASELLSRSSS